VTVQEGKDLGDVAAVVGVGGVLAHASNARFLLEGARARADDPASLLPRGASLYVDRDYVLYAVGLLSQLDPQAALAIARRHLVRL
jgi:hypothetical protein